MLKYIIRLDDACPKMNEEKWTEMTKLLNKYDIKPIVGIIPNCQDKEFENNKIIDDFWEKYALNWQNKKWIIAQHGLNHNLNKVIRTEYKGKTYDEQKNNLVEGNKILKDKNINPVCFFAPAHTFDDNTIRACVDLNYFEFISDGVALYPYRKNDIFFLPNIFDTPHKILPFGIYTFVFHPNNMTESDFNKLEKFIKKNKKKFEVDIEQLLHKYSKRKRNIMDLIIEFLIKLLRHVKGNRK